MVAKHTTPVDSDRSTGRKRSVQPSPADEIQEAIDYGIDVSALKDNLALTPAERLRRHDIALNLVEMLQKAKRV